MKIVAYILTWNEEDILPFTLNWYTSFCDKVILYDNFSQDKTMEIAAQYKKVQVRKFDTGGGFNDGIHLEIKNNCWKESRDADFVIVCDADEFLYSENLLADLAKFKDFGVTIPMIKGYNMCSLNFPDDYTQPIFGQVTKGVRALNFDKRIIFNPKAIEEINYGAGAHFSNPTGKIVEKDGLKLLHMKYLGERRLTLRHREYKFRLSKFNKERNYGWQYLDDTHVKAAFNALQPKLIKVI